LKFPYAVVHTEVEPKDHVYSRMLPTAVLPHGLAVGYITVLQGISCQGCRET
jgi:hypothetical protein